MALSLDTTLLFKIHSTPHNNAPLLLAGVVGGSWSTVGEELARLKALYDGFGYRELARILWHKVHERIDDKTVKQLWHHSPTPVQGELPFSGYHSHADRYQARLQVVKLYYQADVHP